MQHVNSYHPRNSYHLADNARDWTAESLAQTFRDVSSKERHIWCRMGDRYGTTPLAWLVEADHPQKPQINAVRLLVEWGADPLQGDKQGVTPFHRAVASIHLEILSFFLERCNPNSVTLDGSTPLHMAVIKREHFLTGLLIHKGADPNKQNYFGTPLSYAVIQGNQTLCELLLEKGADPNASSDPLMVSPLRLAYEGMNQKIIRILKEKNGEFDLPFSFVHHTCLSRLALCDIAPIVQTLFKGAHASTAVTLFAQRILEEIAEKGNSSVLVSLKQFDHTGASKAGTQQEVFEKVKEVWELMITEEHQKGTVDKFGRLVVHYCAFTGNNDFWPKLNNLRNIDVADVKKRTPLHYAVIAGYLSTVTQLLPFSNCKAQDVEGFTPLHWACILNHDVTACTLLKADPQTAFIADRKSWLPIHYSAKKENIMLIYQLIHTYKVDPYVQTNEGQSPLSIGGGNRRIQAIYSELQYIPKIPSPPKNMYE